MVDDTKILLNILMLYLPLPIFWALFDQQGSKWTFQAERMDLDLGFYKLPAELNSIWNPLLVLVFIPLFEFVIYPLLGKVGFGRPLQRLTVGGFLAAVSFVLTALVEWKIANNPKNSVSIFWQLPQYLVITLAEIMFSITGLSFSYEQAPASMKSVVTSYWLLTMAVGNAIIIAISGISFSSRINESLLFAGIMALDLLVFMYIARRYKPRICHY